MTTITPTISAETEPYRPRGAAKQLLECRDPEILISGPAGTGKTLACCIKAYLVAEKYPACRILLVRKTRASLSESALVTWEQKAVPPGHPCLHGAHRAHRVGYEFSNGSRVVLGGMDNVDRIMSSEYDLIVAFEALQLTEEDWQALTTRLRNGVVPYQQAIGDCNPGPPLHHLKARADCGKMTHLVSRHEDNPLLFDGKRQRWTAEGERYLHRLDQLTGLQHDRLRLGRWVGAEGMVYAEFDRRVHVIDPFEIPDDWRRLRSVDFGFTNPACCQWWALDPDDRMYLYRELYVTQTLVEDLAASIKRLTGTQPVSRTVADSADAEGRATLHKRGIMTTGANKEIKIGIQQVQSRLRVQGDGKARLMFFRDALVEPDPLLRETGKPNCTVSEIEQYVWARAKDGQAEKELPVAVNDHGCDAMRYAVRLVDAGSVHHVRTGPRRQLRIRKPSANDIYGGTSRRDGRKTEWHIHSSLFGIGRR